MSTLRVTSSKTRKMIFVVGNALEMGFTPENLELYLPDGTPLNLTKDAARMLWRGEWDNANHYDQNDVVIDDGDLFILKALAINPGGISPALENQIPGSVIETRTAYTYAFSNANFADTPILIRDIPFTNLAMAPVGNIWIGGGSKMLSFDAEPGSQVTITCDGGPLIGFKDTGAPGSGNTAVAGTTPHASPWVVTMPAEGRMTLEVPSTTTTVTVAGLGVTYDHTGVVTFPGSGGGNAFPLILGERIYPKGQPIFYFDLVSGGTVTIRDTGVDNEYLQLYDSTGADLGNNFSGGGFGSAFIKTDLDPGRYFVRDQEAIQTSPPPLHIVVTPSAGAMLATFDPDIKFWDVLFRASSGPAGPTGPTGPAGAAGAAGATGATGAAGAATGILDAWGGDWEATNYLAGAVVRHTSGLYLALTAAHAANEPGDATVEDDMATMPGAWSGSPHDVPRSTGVERPYVGTATVSDTNTVFFDVTTAGTVIVSSSVSSQVIRFNSTGNYSDEHTGTSWNMGSLSPGRYFLAFWSGGAGTFTLGGTAALAPNSGNPWELMVQGA